MSDLEKLAREICWSGFSPFGRKGKTKAEYWNSITEVARENYRADAKKFVWTLHAIPEKALELAISMQRCAAPGSRVPVARGCVAGVRGAGGVGMKIAYADPPYIGCAQAAFTAYLDSLVEPCTPPSA